MGVRYHTRVVALLAGLVVEGLWSAPAGWAHPGQHIGLKTSITDEKVVHQVSMSNDCWKTIIPEEHGRLDLTLEGDEFRLNDPAQEQRIRAAFEDLFQRRNPLTIDGVVVPPVLERLAFVSAANAYGLRDPLAPPDAEFVIAYPTKAPPRRVAIVCELYPTDPAGSAGALPGGALLAELDAYAERRMVVFTSDEPEVVWHRPDRPMAQRVQPVLAAAEPATLALPLISAGIVLVWLLVLLALRVAKVGRGLRRWALCLSVVPLAIAWFCRESRVLELAPPWAARVKLPGEQQAAEIFATLQRNIYRAFDCKKEGDIYDVLAQSVDGDLLEQIYNEVYRGLIMRDQGGALARVHSIDVLDARLVSTGRMPESGQSAFQIRSRWQVYGVVSHWGHFHARRNEYQAVYTVAQVGDKWKIAGVKNVEQRRVEADGSAGQLVQP